MITSTDGLGHLLVTAARTFQAVDMFVPLITISSRTNPQRPSAGASILPAARFPGGLMADPSVIFRHGRACPDFIPHLCCYLVKTWMPGTRPGMTILVNGEVHAGRSDRAKWIDAFCEIFRRCAVKAGDTAAILSETQSRAINVHLAELALLRMGARPFRHRAGTPRNKQAVPIRSTGASEAIQRLAPVVTGVAAGGFCGRLLHRRIDARGGDTGDPPRPAHFILVISNEHRSAGTHGARYGLEKRVRAAARCCAERSGCALLPEPAPSSTSTWRSASTVGVWGWTDKPGTLAHWPGGIVVSFPKAAPSNGTLVMAAGDINLTFKRYLASPVKMTLKDDTSRTSKARGRCDDACLSRGMG